MTRLRGVLTGAVRVSFLAAVLIASFAACSRGQSVAIVGSDGHQRAAVEVELADTEAERETGLMYRQNLGEDSGMLFVFGSPRRLSFWMKNTEIPLDMIFADRDGRIVGIVENAEPYTESPRAVNADSEYVLEVNGGFAARHKVKNGDHLVFRGFAPRAEN